MRSANRRIFLGSSVASLGTGSYLFGQNGSPPKAPYQPKDAATEAILRRLGAELPAFQPQTLFLTWHRDPTTTMVVQWIGVRGETPDTTVFFTDDSRVTTRKDPLAAVDSKAKATIVPWRSVLPQAKYFPMTDFLVYRAELTGLSPGTEHVFKIGKSSPTWRFRTMPRKATDSFSFISGGDCGVNLACLENNRLAARQNPMFAVIGGDLGYDNGRSPEVSLAFLRNYSTTMVDTEGRLVPLVVCIGNHEVNGGYGARDKATFFYPLFDGLFPETGYNRLDFGDYLSLVLLDTGHTSRVEGAQTDWLDRTLAARKDHPHTLVVNHVPAYPSHRNPLAVLGKDGKTVHGTGENQRKHWVPLFDKYRVPVVLEHHDHTFKRTKPLIGGLEHCNGVQYLGDGSWGRLRIPRKDDQLNVLMKTSDDYHISLHRLEGNARFHLAMDHTGKVMDMVQTGQRRAGLVAVGGS
jgi:hypothetical protein